MASYNRFEYVRRLGVTPTDGVYTFTFDEGNEVHDQLVGDLAMEYALPMPKDGNLIKISTKGKKVTGITVEEDPSMPGGRRRRHRKTQRKTRRKTKKNSKK